MAQIKRDMSTQHAYEMIKQLAALRGYSNINQYIPEELKKQLGLTRMAEYYWQVEEEYLTKLELRQPKLKTNQKDKSYFREVQNIPLK